MSASSSSRIEYSYPLSPLQEGMLFHTLNAPRSGVYVRQLVGVLDEALDRSSFRRAWEWVVDRHPALRTSVSFAESSGKLLQQVHTSAAESLTFEEHDLEGIDAAEREKQLRLYLEADRRRGFEVGEQTPLMRLALLRMEEADYRLVWTSHHALLDDRSRLRVLSELFSAYEAFCQGEIPRCDPPARPYRDYVEWLGARDMAKAQRFWREALRGFNAPTPLGVEATGSGSASPDDDGFGRRGVRLSERTTAALERLADQHGLTLNTLVQGAWALLLNRYSGEEDIVFGATRECRKPPEECPGEVWVGLFINTLPVRVRLSPEKPLILWLQELRAQWGAAREHEHTPLVDVQSWSEVPSRTPLFESVVVFEHRSLQAALQEEGGERWAEREFGLIQATNYPLTVSAWGGPELLLEMGFDLGRFDEVTIERMLEHLRTLLGEMATHPHARPSELAMLSEAEQGQILTEWNDTKTDYPKDKCLHTLFEEQVERTPDAIAVVFEDQQLTYRELNRRANLLARYLRTLGVGPEVLVGICMERSVEMVVGLLGILKAGGAYVPLDPSFPKERLAFMIEDTRVPVLLTQQRLAEGLPEHAARVVRLDADWGAIAQESGEDLAGGAMGENLAYVIYTSGSTGRPKGVAVEHKQLLNYTHAMLDRLQLAAGASFAMVQPLAVDSCVTALFLPLSIGGRLHVISPERAVDAQWLGDYFQRHPIDCLKIAPSHLVALQASSRPEQVMPRRWLIIGGEASRWGWVQTLPSLALDCAIFNHYGPTETTVGVLTYHVGAEQRPTHAYSTTPLGRPLANTQVYLLDRHLRPVPVGVPGELYIGGANLTRGYLDRPELTAEKFIPDPFSMKPGARLYRSGDVARYLPDGKIEYLGRLDEQLKIRGFRIEPGEVEAALAEHPTVREAVVLAHDDRPGEARLVSYVVPYERAAPMLDDLRKFLKGRLPEYMLPSALMVLDELPHTPHGKVDRRALPAPEGLYPEREGAFTAPCDPLEDKLAEVWSEVLGFEQVGIHDDFFELGGHSLLATQVVSRVRTVFGIELPVRCIFEEPTVAELAKKIIQRQAEEADHEDPRRILAKREELL